MHRLIRTILLLLVLAPALRAQDDFQRINEESYRCYLASQWDSVLIIGKEALKKDIDYYYLRVRMGIARYEKENYRKAALHFRRALEFYEGDPLSLEYLYYSYLFSGQEDHARLIRKTFRGNLALKLPPERGKPLESVAAEGLYSWGAGDELISDPDLSFPLSTAGVQYLTRHYTNLSLSLSHRVGAGSRIRQSYTYLDKTNYMFFYNGQTALEVPDQHVYQHQYYLSPSFMTQSGFRIAPSFHLLSVHYQALQAVSIVGGTGPGMGQGSGSGSISTSVVRSQVGETDFTGGVEVGKSLGCVDLVLGAWYAGLNGADQAQGRLGATWYPLGNLKLYTSLFLNGQYSRSDREEGFHLIPELHLGYAIAGRLWVDLNGAWGSMSNYLEQNGAVVFNSFYDTITRKAMLTLSLPLGQKGSLAYLGARWTAHTSEFFADDSESAADDNPINYHAYSIFGGLSWTF